MHHKQITISEKEYVDLLKSQAHLSALEVIGVDNWQGYVGPTRDCAECSKEDISWVYSKCVNCGAMLPEPADLI